MPTSLTIPFLRRRKEGGRKRKSEERVKKESQSIRRHTLHFPSKPPHPSLLPRREDLCARMRRASALPASPRIDLVRITLWCPQEWFVEVCLCFAGWCLEWSLAKARPHSQDMEKTFHCHHDEVLAPCDGKMSSRIFSHTRVASLTYSVTRTRTHPCAALLISHADASLLCLMLCSPSLLSYYEKADGKVTHILER